MYATARFTPFTQWSIQTNSRVSPAALICTLTQPMRIEEMANNSPSCFLQRKVKGEQSLNQRRKWEAGPGAPLVSAVHMPFARPSFNWFMAEGAIKTSGSNDVR